MHAAKQPVHGLYMAMPPLASSLGLRFGTGLMQKQLRSAEEEIDRVVGPSVQVATSQRSRSRVRRHGCVSVTEGKANGPEANDL